MGGVYQYISGTYERLRLSILKNGSRTGYLFINNQRHIQQLAIDRLIN